MQFLLLANTWQCPGTDLSDFLKQCLKKWNGKLTAQILQVLKQRENSSLSEDSSFTQKTFAKCVEKAL